MKSAPLFACLAIYLATCLALSAQAAEQPSAKLGAGVFKARCTTCHGSAGKGDGPAARTLPVNPANLTKSRAPNDYLKLLITEGGDAMGRSASMPPWGEVLTPLEIDSLVLHINTLRPPLK